VVQAGGTAAGAAIQGITVAGKTGTAQTLRFSKNGKPLYWAWFAGMAPADNPKIVVVVMFPDVEFEGATAAGFATKIIERYLKVKVDANSIERTG
jgi:cell division protein FtsI/penicillin-binding protein 2